MCCPINYFCTDLPFEGQYPLPDIIRNPDLVKSLHKISSESTSKPSSRNNFILCGLPIPNFWQPVIQVYFGTVMYVILWCRNIEMYFMYIVHVRRNGITFSFIYLGISRPSPMSPLQFCPALELNLIYLWKQTCLCRILEEKTN